MAEYLKWISENTPARWWCDGAIMEYLEKALPYGAAGVTSNPKLACEGYKHDWEYWKPKLQDLKDVKGDERSIQMYQRIITPMAKAVEHIYHATNGRDGYACVQMNPLLATDTQGMVELARRANSWAPNISIKVPCTKSGIKAVEILAAEGIALTVTMGFAMAEMIGVAKAYEIGYAKAIENGVKPRHCHCVMFGHRIPNYLRQIVKERNLTNISDNDCKLAALALVRRTYEMLVEGNYKCELFCAGMLEYETMRMMAGAKMLITFPWLYTNLVDNKPEGKDWECGINDPFPQDVLDRLLTIPEFKEMYDDDGLPPDEWFNHGPMQWAIGDFTQLGWVGMQNLPL